MATMMKKTAIEQGPGEVYRDLELTGAKPFIKESSMSESKMTRRIFLGAAAATAGAALVRPRVARAASPNSKLNIAAVGIGGRGRSDIHGCGSENIVALCDVDDKYAAKVFGEYPKAKRYKDYREMLDKQKDIDAVIVATPD